MCVVIVASVCVQTASAQSLNIQALYGYYYVYLAVAHQVRISPCGKYIDNVKLESLDEVKGRVRKYLTQEERRLLESGEVDREARAAYHRVQVELSYMRGSESERCTFIAGYALGKVEALKRAIADIPSR
jgi:hypothetical protein